MELTIEAQGNFYVSADVNDVTLTKSHIKSYEKGIEILESLKDVATFAELRQHYMVKGEQRGFWLVEASVTNISKEITSHYKEDNR
jgi:hypothetical protein